MAERNKVLILLALLSVITYLDRVCIAVAGPQMQKDLDLSPQAWGWVTGAFAVAYGLFEIPSGWMGDRLGPRRCLTRIVLCWSAFTAITGVVTGSVSLVLTRFAFGAGEAGAYPNISIAIRRWFGARERNRAFGVVWMASQGGGVLAGVLLAPLQSAFGWRTSFFVLGAAGAMWCAAWWIHYREPARTRTAAEVPARHGEEGLRAIASSANVWTLAGIAFCYCHAMYFFLAWLPTYLAESRGFSHAELNYSALPFLLGMVANGSGGWMADHLMRRFGGRRGRQLLGFAALAVAGACILGAAATPNRWICVGLLSICYGSISLQQPAVWAACADESSESTGAAAGVMNSAAQAGSFTFAVSYGYLQPWLRSYDGALAPAGGALMVGAFLWLRLKGERRIAS